ncbi:Phage tail sheath protein FI [Fulvivirga imtechensis AK7]|uniref:Phage tail sheath protein FI n=1 Tax=Fulvivirga imtechensis AK7 TaxID=1237149 RepID=L8JQF9_9BACT|nr:phage tail sheath C-terminal domain-containing protein [Fulvivirga imtechensis]ELR71191.1 Phage tail sheath protein FI [Fulvivirga imtechensis AK7]
MAQVLATPGVYIEEKSAFPSSVVAVPTAVPAFIGYTEKASRGNKSIINVPTRITSLGEFHQFFGGAPKVTFEVAEDEKEQFKVTVNSDSRYNLYNCMRLFFANGGSTCYIVSVGDYTGGVKAAQLNDEENEGGIKTLLKEPEPTMLVIPDAVLLEEAECNSLQQAMLQHCGLDMRNRVAILDVYNGDTPRTMADDDVITKFREGVGNNFLQWGAAYYPWLSTTIVSADDVNYTNISNLDGLTGILNKEVDDMVANEIIKEKRGELIKAEIEQLSNADADVVTLHQTLNAVSPMYKTIMGEVRNQLNVLPPSAGMAGVISMVDNSVGVFQSPANVSVGSVVKPAVNITNTIQEDLNLPLNGKAVNAIRTFPGKGVLVWGARTLDGNSMDWRYLSVRRTVIMIEQSLKAATEAYVFKPNVVNTWVTVKGMMTNFLTDQWKRGALAGSSPEDAFSVDVGLGVTMTPTDILDGIMRITVKLAVVRPAEFIVITIQQQMQKS